MEGKFLDDAMVRRLEKLPSKKELIATIARLIKQARQTAQCSHNHSRAACANV